MPNTRLLGWMIALAFVFALSAVCGAADKGPLQQAGKSGGARKAGPEEKGPLDQALKAAEAKKVEPLIVRIHNVQDLMMGCDYPYCGPPTPTMTGGQAPVFESASVLQQAGAGGGLFAGATAIGDAAAMASALNTEVLIAVIMRTVDTENWEDSGGRGKIDSVGPLLVITQTAENQKKIAELLDQFRAAKQMVTIEARWVLLDDAQVAKLIPEGGKRTVPVEVAPGALVAAEAKVIYRGQITGFDRQKVHVATGKVQRYVENATPVVAENAIGWDPQLGALLMGAVLEITPALAPDGKSATLDLESHISEAGDMRTKTFTGAVSGEKGESAKADIDLPEWLVHTFRTTLRVPLDKPVLIGGMTAPKAADGKVLYLILEISASK